RDLSKRLGTGRADESLKVQRDDLDRERVDLKRELRRVRLAHAGEKARLELAKDEKALAARKEELAGMAAQEKLLREDLNQLEERYTRLLDRLKVNGVGAMDLESFKEDIEQTVALAKRAREEVQKLQVELDAPPRIWLFEEATVLKKD